MPDESSRETRVRPNRGRPTGPTTSDRRRTSAPTHTRLLALRVLERVSSAGAYADLLLHSALARSSLNAPDRAFATDLVYGTLRWRGKIDYYLSHFVDQDLAKLEPLVASTLQLGAYQLLCTDRVPASAAVDQSVRCIRAAGMDRATGLVNAVLRRLSLEHDKIMLPSIQDDPTAHLTHALSFPRWLAERWIERFGVEGAVEFAKASNQIPPLTIRANRARGDAGELLQDLLENFPAAAACRFATDGIVLGRKGNPARDPSFLAGRFTVQDEASQLVVALLDPQPGEQVLDLCAAPGGKTTAIAERVGPSGFVVAVDRNARRLDLVQRAVRRLGLSGIRTVVRDATRSLAALAPPGGFDRILVDAPCSGLGTLRRNPDAKWRVRPGDPARLAEVQRALLGSAASVLRPGGVLVYSVCTVLAEENEEIVRHFLRRSRDFAAVPKDALPEEVKAVADPEGFLQTSPHSCDTDGFFAARFERRT
ncbi:MAG: 16S rRNA (cytosine(967)-C(5))-methyltransferase RsmB [Deltaproteobacteria bacterium]|nr:16S rRNA (cytosine(967)-C(5))-methyltransferase RsmB [Deltaproteobacteria bacterium]MBW2576449.1 16S rRNA (cytosine(967)-C(5))-methyltransferase RsmB [Deltaproteobacteria bacterium]